MAGNTAQLSIMYVSGPAGVVAAEYPIEYNAATQTVSIDLSYLSGVGGGVTYVNGISGAVNILGINGISVTNVGQNIVISGVNLANSGDIQALSDSLGLTGSYLYNLIVANSGGSAPTDVVYLTGDQTIDGLKTFTRDVTIKEGVIISPTGTNAETFYLGSQAFYSNDYQYLTTGVLPLITGSTGRSYLIKNKGAPFVLVAQGTDQIFAAYPVPFMTVYSGEAYNVLNDGYHWAIL